MMTRALLIDDDDLTRQMLQTALERMGVETHSAHDGEEGLRLFDVFPVDIVITDMIMPGLDGLDVIGRLRVKEPDITIVAISGGGCRIKVEDCLENASQMGVDRVLQKPFSVFDLKALVVELTSDSR